MKQSFENSANMNNRTMDKSLLSESNGSNPNSFSKNHSMIDKML